MKLDPPPSLLTAVINRATQGKKLSRSVGQNLIAQTSYKKNTVT